MRTYLPAAVALCVVVTAAAFHFQPPQAAPGELAVVRAVLDGDTVRVGGGDRVRLLQIDAPELRAGECYAQAARAELLRLAPIGARVVLERDPALGDVDRYGRKLRYLRRGELDVGLELVRRGAAAPYFYRSQRGRYAERLEAAARAAQARGRGLWRACPDARLRPERALDSGRPAGG